ncbi:MAG: putative secreted protein [Candidatus Phytoplasma cynodontis]|nr:MAG: putative secreted protein [Candidatus Phytoplasma cynodontis]
MTKIQAFYLFCISLLLSLGIGGWLRQKKRTSPRAIKKEITQAVLCKKALGPVHSSKWTEIVAAASPKISSITAQIPVCHLSLGQQAGMEEALTWLKEHFPEKTFIINHFSYGLYNPSDAHTSVTFEKRFQEPIPPGFLLAYIRSGQNNLVSEPLTLKNLMQSQPSGVVLYLFWKRDPFQDEVWTFDPQNYQIEVLYDRGTPFGGNSFVHLTQLILKNSQTQQVVALFPLNMKIEEPFNIFNYDFGLKFPFYNYESQGLFWSTNSIKSLKKIDLYEKKTGQSRTLYYDAE